MFVQFDNTVYMTWKKAVLETMSVYNTSRITKIKSHASIF